jgi:predicted phage terminase large subunit-like protein
MIIAGKTSTKELYVLDVYYTQEASDVTEQETAKRLDSVQKQYGYPIKCTIESNSAGGVIARNIQRILKDTYKNVKVSITPKNQSKNKYSRILAYSNVVQNIVLFPVNWKGKYKDFYAHMVNFQKEQKANKHDDGADCITALCEMIDEQKKAYAITRL